MAATPLPRNTSSGENGSAEAKHWPPLFSAKQLSFVSPRDLTPIYTRNAACQACA
jgi:hypothetical protein